MRTKEAPSFDDFWDRIITRAIRLCSKELDPDFSSKTDLRMRNLEEFRIELEKTYKLKRKWLQNEYLPEEPVPSLDFHKLGSILCRCIIGNKFYTYDVKKADAMQMERKYSEQYTHKEQLIWNMDNLYVNYKLAFLVGQGVAFDDLLFWAQDRIDTAEEELKKDLEDYKKADLQEKIKLMQAFITQLTSKERKLRPYNCSKTHDDFVSSMIFSLMKSDTLMRDFDYLSFGVIMFQWQEYTKQAIFTEIIMGLDRNISEQQFFRLFSTCMNWD